MSKIIVIIDGNEYEARDFFGSKHVSGYFIKECVDHGSGLELRHGNGNIFFIGPELIKRAAFIISD